MHRKSFAHLSIGKRRKLARLRSNGSSMRACARALHIDVSTVSRELKRSPVETSKGDAYVPRHAQFAYEGRRKACHPHIKMSNQSLRRVIMLYLQKGWSPETIANTLQRIRGSQIISHETLYDFIYTSEIGKRDKLYEYLPRGKRKRTKKYGRKTKQQRLEGRTFIDQRPTEAAERIALGHWETDSVLCKRRESINVLVERVSRKVIITKLTAKDAQATTNAITNRLSGEHVLSITADNGPENAGHKKIAEQLNTRFFFCHPYHSWEKGTVENRNGVIRRSLPGTTDLQHWTQEELDEVAEAINTTPMKCLDYQTPNFIYSRCCI